MSSIDPSDPRKSAAQARNRRLAGVLALVFVGMIGAAYAAVPLYRAFCQITGFGGVVSRAEAAPSRVLDQTVTVRFDANVRDLPWSFAAEQRTQKLRIGETGLAFFKVTNHSDEPVTGRAVYNVTPTQAGAYFRKLECFCFSDQTIGPGKTVEFPMVYFIEPEYAEDFETRGKTELTLSYTFFKQDDGERGEKRADASEATMPSALGGTPRAGL